MAFSSPSVHDVHTVTAELNTARRSDTNDPFAFVDIRFEQEREFTGKDRAELRVFTKDIDFARRLADAINALAKQREDA